MDQHPRVNPLTNRGIAEPPQADELITRMLKDDLALLNIRILDHLIIAGGEVLSFSIGLMNV